MKFGSISVLFLCFWLPGAWAADAENGKALYDENCMRCHDKSIHTRPDSIIHSMEALKERVSFCDMAAQTHFTDDQKADVIKYLNQTFYNFEES